MSSRENPYRRPDAYAVKAKGEGYPARSVYKLQEIDRRVRLFKRGQKVVDLGAAPGSWSMYVSKAVGPEGRVLAIDLTEITVGVGGNARVVQGDALQVEAEVFASEGPFDVVLSDMAPSTSGSRAADQWVSYELVVAAIEIAAVHGKPHSSFVGKIFMSDDFPKARDRLRALYKDVRTLRPDTVRKQSYEVFLVGLDKKP